MNTSRPRTFSMISMLTSPSLKRPTEARPTGAADDARCRAPAPGLALPAKIARVRSSHRRHALPLSANSDRKTVHTMAGVEGFEPPNGGIKTRCLTTWRHPSKVAHAAGRGHSTPAPRNSSSNPARAPRRPPRVAALSKLRRCTTRSPSDRAGADCEPANPAPQQLPGSARAHRLAVVAAARFEKAAYCDERRISCQFRGLEYLARCRPRPPGE